MVTAREINHQLRACGARTNILSKGEARCLPTIIHPGETIRAFVYGSHPAGFGMMVATDRRLLYVNKVFFDTKIDEVMYASVAAVEYDLGIRYGKLKIYTRAKDFEFKYINKRYLRPFVTFVNEQVAAAQSYPQPQEQEELQRPHAAPYRQQPRTATPALTQLKNRLQGQDPSTQRPYL